MPDGRYYQEMVLPNPVIIYTDKKKSLYSNLKMYTGLYAFHAAPQLPIKYPKFYSRELKHAGRRPPSDPRLSRSPPPVYRAGRGPGGHQVSENVARGALRF